MIKKAAYILAGLTMLSGHSVEAVESSLGETTSQAKLAHRMAKNEFDQGIEYNDDDEQQVEDDNSEPDSLQDTDGSLSYSSYQDSHVKAYPPKYENCASGCICDGSVSVVSAYYGIQDITDKIAHKYRSGVRVFIADPKMLKANDGYAEPYPYDTLSITY